VFQTWPFPEAHGSPDIKDTYGKAGSIDLGRFMDTGPVWIDFAPNPVLQQYQVRHDDIGAAREIKFAAFGSVEGSQSSCAGDIGFRADQTRKCNDFVSQFFGVWYLLIQRSKRRYLTQGLLRNEEYKGRRRSLCVFHS
jgi:hypothetical protein